MNDAQHEIDRQLPVSVATVEGRPTAWIGGAQCIRYEVVGENYNPHQMQHVVAALKGRTDVVVAAWLLSEDPPSPHDPTAVVVWVMGGKVGFLPGVLARAWHPILARLRGRFVLPIACQATIDPPSAANFGGYGIAVWLPRIPDPQPRAPALQAAAPPQTPAPQPAPPTPAAPRSPPAQVAQRTPESADTPAASLAMLSRPTPSPDTSSSPELLAELRARIAEARSELTSVEEALEIQSFGFYAPKYGFESSAKYVSRLKGIRDSQVALIKDNLAAPCDVQWKVGGSAAEGRKMVKQQAKLMLRAFNGECDAAIAKVRYDNVGTLQQRLEKAFSEINKLGAVQQVYISRRYFDLKLAELHLVHEHREKVQEEKEAQKRIREQMREEQRALEEIERSRLEAEKAEVQSAAALERARAELAAAESTSKQHERLEGLVTRLETELQTALDRKAKAIARAQLTKSGHVYVLSNIGSFGEGVYKLGMTRRLDPYERVDELGDASVPFPFDVHAIIYSPNAPALEANLHRAFASRRVNRVNPRKEYFRVTLDEIRGEVERLHGLVTFQLDAEAEDFRKSLAAATAGMSVDIVVDTTTNDTSPAPQIESSIAMSAD